MYLIVEAVVLRCLVNAVLKNFTEFSGKYVQSSSILEHFPAIIYLFNISNRNTRKGVKYVQS